MYVSRLNRMMKGGLSNKRRGSKAVNCLFTGEGEPMKRVIFAFLFLSLLILIMTPALMANDKASPPPSTTVADPSNDYLAIQVGSDGRFNSGATGLNTGSSFNISYAWPRSPWSSFTTVRIDGTDNIYGGSGTQTQPPTDVSSLENTSSWQIGNILVTQDLSIVNGTSTGRPDTGEYKYTVTNTDTVPHDVGIRVMIDTMLNSNDGAPFRVPGVGAVTTETEFDGGNMPEYWQAFYSLSDPNIMAQGTLIGGAATKPDRFVISAWPNIEGTQWDYTINPSQVVTNDSAATMWWNPGTLAPGESRDYVTYYGLGTVSGTADLSVTGPASLTPVVGGWSPNPFDVTTYVANNTGADMNNVDVTLSLPSGLALAGGETATHTIASIPAGSTGQSTWSVQALSEGDWTYSVTGIGQTVNRTISVPHTCTVGQPALSLSGVYPFWASYTDYTNGLLSVTYTISNGPGSNAYNVMMFSQATNGVNPATPLPVAVGDIPAGSSATATLQYTVPSGVLSFTTMNGAIAADECGNVYFYGSTPPPLA